MIKDAISKPEINFWIGLAIPMLGIAVMWGTMTARIDHLEDMTIGLQDTYAEQRVQNTEIQVRLAEIQKDVLYIKQQIAN